MKTFSVLVKSDSKRLTRINVVAKDWQAAKRIILTSEKCPERAIRSFRIVANP